MYGVSEAGIHFATTRGASGNAATALHQPVSSTHKSEQTSCSGLATPTSSSGSSSYLHRERRHLQAVGGASLEDSGPRPTTGSNNTVMPTDMCAPEPRPAPAAPSAPPSRPAAVTAIASPPSLTRPSEGPRRHATTLTTDSGDGREEVGFVHSGIDHLGQEAPLTGGLAVRGQRLGEEKFENDGNVVVRAERRAKAAEKAAVIAANEARVAKAERERLRTEALELSRWREAVFDLRDVLEVAEREGADGGGRRNGRDDGERWPRKDGCLLVSTGCPSTGDFREKRSYGRSLQKSRCILYFAGLLILYHIPCTHVVALLAP